MKISPELASGRPVVITEPMIATGGSLDLVISVLKDKGVDEGNIIIASVCVAPEGLLYLNDKFPKIKVVMTALDEKLNEKKYIVPGLGDFGDRFFGTPEEIKKGKG
jgi:uracil phosphoribosyltransferase